MTTRYDHPNATVLREVALGNLTGVASGQMGKFRMFQKQKLKKVHACVQVAGTATAAGVDIYVGTTSVGAITFGTNTAGTELSSGAIDATVSDNESIRLMGLAGSATLVGSFTMLTQVLPDAVSV